MIITIDGPAGSGKSTAARKLAETLGIAFLDTGATYRAVTLEALRSDADMEDDRALSQIARQMNLEMHPNPNGVRVLMKGLDVTDEIRSAEVTENTHYIARSPATRKVLVELQRDIARQLGDCVTEGRDQGSVVFPDADVKFYLLASPEARAQRRCEEMTAAGQDVSYEQILQAIEQRDSSDMNRSVGPLVKPDGAVEVDTTDNTLDQT